MSTRNSIVSLAIATTVTLGLSGCTLENTATAPTEITMGAVQGRIMGGETPVAGSQITLWETDPGNTGYGLTAKVLEGPVTGSTPGGNFSFNTGYTCDAGQFLYITSTGGDVTNGSSNPIINPNLVMISALGSCSNFGTTAAKNATTVVVNELTTIAAAYALGAFTTVNENIGTGTVPVGTQLVYIGAPANNNVAMGACTGVGSAMTCTAAGLAHAFANATNLVDSVHFDGTFPLGAVTANTTVPGNALGSIPTAEVNALANVLAYCTNTSGGSGTAGTSGGSDGTHCGNLFSDSKPTACATSACVPQDTLSAAIDMGKNPSHNAATIIGLQSSTPPFQPAITALPSVGTNLTIAIVYSGALSNFGAPFYLSLDTNDNVYILSGDLPTPTQAGVSAMSSSGTPLWNTGYNTNFCLPQFIATDTVGNVWTANDASSSTVCGTTTGNYEILGLSQSSGATNYTFNSTSIITNTSQPISIAVDQYNNIWFDRSSSNCTNCLYKIPYSGGASTGGTYTTNVSEGLPLSGTNAAHLNQVMIDGYQNIWVSTLGTSSTSTPEALYVVPNTNAGNYTSTTVSSVPTYNAATYYDFTGPGTTGYSFGLAIDSGNNAWDTASNVTTATTSKLTTPTSGGVINGNPTVAGASTTFTTESKVYQAVFDGLGQLWYAYYNTGGEGVYYVYNPLGTSVSGGSSQSNKGIEPCYAPANASACSSTLPFYDTRSLQIDSTGSVWVTSLGPTPTPPATAGAGDVVQLVGAAYPTWPQLSYAHYGVEPQ